MSYGPTNERKVLDAMESFDTSGYTEAPWLKHMSEEVRDAAANMRAQQKTVLDEAKALVYGDREAAYGHPYHDFKRIADVWTGYLAGRSTITPADVPQLMILLKACRAAVDIERGKPPKHDTIVDEAGYAECANRVAEYDGQKGTATRPA